MREKTNKRNVKIRTFASNDFGGTEFGVYSCKKSSIQIRSKIWASEIRITCLLFELFLHKPRLLHHLRFQP
jgi:hypothetical protein